MPRNWSKAVPEGKGPILQQEEFRSGQPTLADVYRVMKKWSDQSDKYWDSMKSHFDQQEQKLDELGEMTRGTSQRLVGLEEDARQPRFAIKPDGSVNTKAYESTEGAARAVQEMHGDSCFANRVDPNQMWSTSFGDDCTGPLALPFPRDDTLVANGAAAPKSCLSSLEMRSPTATGGLLPTGKTSTPTKTIFDHPAFWFCQTEQTILRTSTPSCRRVIETNLGQNRMFDPGGSEGRLRACPFLGTWRALLSGKGFFWNGWWRSAAFFRRVDDSGFKNLHGWYRRTIYAVRIAVDRCFPRGLARSKCHARLWELEGKLEMIRNQG